MYNIFAFFRNQGLNSMFDLDVNDQRLLVNTLLLRSQKLSESRAEGSISEPSTEGNCILLSSTHKPRI